MGTFVDPTGKTQDEIDDENEAAGTGNILYGLGYSDAERDFLYANIPLGVSDRSMTLPDQSSIPDEDRNIIYLTQARIESVMYYRLLNLRNLLADRPDQLRALDGALLAQEKRERLYLIESHDEFNDNEPLRDYSSLLNPA